MNSSARLLLVDDNDLILASLGRALRKQFPLDVAEGPAKALAALSNGGPYGVIVSDMRMPGMNGIEFLSEARILYPQTIRILLSGNAESEEADEAIRKGIIFRHLQKPCPIPEMIQILQMAQAAYRDNTQGATTDGKNSADRAR
jgi:DNA-binding NtrC family response regulator